MGASKGAARAAQPMMRNVSPLDTRLQAAALCLAAERLDCGEALRVGNASAIRASSGDARPFAVTSPPVRYKEPSRLRNDLDSRSLGSRACVSTNGAT
jgi:hypothetical protein